MGTLTMDSPEDQTQSFIVRVWLERKAHGRHGAVWRGHVTHVPSGDRAYIDQVDSVAAFMLPYLARMGVWLGPRTRLRLWVHRGWQRIRRQRGKR